MKRTLIAAGLVLASGSALADQGLPQPSFNDGSNVEAQAITGSRTVVNNFPKFNGSALGGPTGAATVLRQSEQPEALRQAILVAPSFNG
jgi:hypothetical protein